MSLYTLIASKPYSRSGEWQDWEEYPSDHALHENITRAELIETAAGYLCRPIAEDEARWQVAFVTVREGQLATAPSFGSPYDAEVPDWAMDIHQETIAKTALFVERRKRVEAEALAARKAAEKALRDRDKAKQDAKREKREKAQLVRLAAKYGSPS